ncbi:MAG TPA: nuclear transport factor 2 family protein [Dehalococcoidia bacterium]|nr:nuclear transport factor 2 family protein [Dehalococcoidia bacterium]
MTADLATLLGLEERGWQALSSDAGRAYYAGNLADDAVLIVPGTVLDKQTWLDALQSPRPWVEHRIEDARLVTLTPDCATLVYRATARRAGEAAYPALISSTYVRRGGRWLLAVHQQTPLPS